MSRIPLTHGITFPAKYKHDIVFGNYINYYIYLWWKVLESKILLTFFFLLISSAFSIIHCDELIVNLQKFFNYSTCICLIVTICSSTCRGCTAPSKCLTVSIDPAITRKFSTHVSMNTLSYEAQHTSIDSCLTLTGIIHK